MTGATIITNIKSDGSCTANIVTSNTVTANIICGGAGPQGEKGDQGIQGIPGNPTTVNAGTNIDIDTISATEITVNTVVDDDAALTANSATAIASQKATKSYADTKVTSNTAITGATKTKITYDTKGLVTSGADATTADIADSLNKRYVTDANLTTIGNQSGTNTGDQDLSGYSLTSHNHTGVYAPVLGADDNYVTNAEKVVIGNTSGTNTGDETQTTIKTKLGAASSSADGYLTSTDWSTFNNKQTALGFTPEDVANKSTSTSLGSSNTLYPSQNAVKVYVDNLLGNENALVYKGTLDCSTNPNYPAASAGHLYIVSVAGKIGGASGTVVDVGDMIICNTDNTVTGTQAAVGQYWNIIEKNIVGAVTGPASSVDSNVAFFDGVTGKVIKDSGITLSGTNTGDNATNSQYSGLDAAKVNKAGDTMSGDLNMGTNELIGGTGITDILKLQGTTGNGTAGSAAIQLLTGNNGATTALTVLNNGNVGIGTTSPGAKLQVDTGAAATVGQIIKGATSQTADLLQIQDSSANKLMVVSSGGNVGIGTSTPQSKMQAQGSGDTFLSATTTSESKAGFFFNYSNLAYAGMKLYYNALDANVYFDNLYPADVVNNFGDTIFRSTPGAIGTQATIMTLKGTGNVGIGTTNPGAQLQVNAGAATYIGQIIKGASAQTADLLQVQDSAGTVLTKVTSSGALQQLGTGYSIFRSSAYSQTPSAQGLSLGYNRSGGNGESSIVWGTSGSTFQFEIASYDGTSTTNRLSITSGGNVGIGTTSPGSLLQVHKTDGSELAVTNTSAGSAKMFIGYDSTGGGGTRQGLEIYRTYGNSAVTLQINQANSNLLLQPSDGNVGIGTTSPGEKLDVSGTVKATGYKSSDGSAGVSGSFTTTDGKTITIKDGLVTSIV